VQLAAAFASSQLAGWISIRNDETRMKRDPRKQACEKESGSKLHALQSFTSLDWLGIGAVGKTFASKLAKRKATASCTHSNNLPPRTAKLLRSHQSSDNSPPL